MTDKDRKMIDLQLLEKLAKLPAPLQDKILYQMEGAIMAMDYLDQQHQAAAAK